MNHCVTDFSVPSTPGIPTAMHNGEDDFMDLLYPLDRYSFTKPRTSKSVSTCAQPPLPQNPPHAYSQLGKAEDEMGSWLHYPLDELHNDLLYQNKSLAALHVPERALESRRPLPKLPEGSASRSFPFISRMMGNNFAVPPEVLMSGGYTVVDSNDTPITSGNHTAVEPANVADTVVAAPPCRSEAAVVTNTATEVIPSVQKRSPPTGERNVEGQSTSPSSSSATNSATAIAHATGELWRRRNEIEEVCRKRKMKEIDESSFVAAANTAATTTETEDVDLESDYKKKHSRGSSAAKRSRTAEVHNLSERKRRDRINEKMRELQQLIPRCDKSDKASMLDEAIEYMKSLQTQIQMMSMGYGMMPMMYPGMQQQYMPLMPPTSMAVGTSMAPAVMPYTPAIPGPVLPAPNFNVPAIASPSVMPPLAPRLPVVPFPLAAAQPSIPADSTGNPYALQIPGMAQIPRIADPYQQYLAYQQIQMQTQMQMGMLAMQTPVQPVSSKKSSHTKSAGDNEEDDVQ
ncbi:hypothetical protein vseg_013463 [Gypsophila vaccaria]